MAGSINFDKLAELNRQGRFELLVEEVTQINEKDQKISLQEKLKLNRYLVSGFLGSRRYKECLDVLNYIIEIPKPDSLRYYDLNAYIGMNDIFCAIGTTELAQTALSKAGET